MTTKQDKAEAVGFVTPDDIAELKEGRIGGHVFPKGTLRPENEMPLYAHPSSRDDVLEALEGECIRLRDKYGHPSRSFYSEGGWRMAERMLAAIRAAKGGGRHE